MARNAHPSILYQYFSTQAYFPKVCGCVFVVWDLVWYPIASLCSEIARFLSQEAIPFSSFGSLFTRALLHVKALVNISLGACIEWQDIWGAVCVPPCTEAGPACCCTHHISRLEADTAGRGRGKEGLHLLSYTLFVGLEVKSGLLSSLAEGLNVNPVMSIYMARGFAKPDACTTGLATVRALIRVGFCGARLSVLLDEL